VQAARVHEQREQQLIEELQALQHEKELAESATRLAQRELQLKVSWHASELEYRNKLRAAEKAAAKQERDNLTKREAAVKQAQDALGSREVSRRCRDWKTVRVLWLVAFVSLYRTGRAGLLPHVTRLRTNLFTKTCLLRHAACAPQHM